MVLSPSSFSVYFKEKVVQLLVTDYEGLTRSTSATVTTSTSFELASLHARVASIKSSIKFTKRHGVSESVSE